MKRYNLSNYNLKPFPRKFLFILLLSMPLPSVFSQELSAYEQCLLQQAHVENAEKALGDIKSYCIDHAEKTKSTASLLHDSPAVLTRISTDYNNLYKPFTLMAHKPNYILPIAYNKQGYQIHTERQTSNPEYALDNVEAHFQMSIKIPIATNLFSKDIRVAAAYTIRAFWQAYNSDISEPFRETNHEPEIWMQFVNDSDILGFRNIANSIGFVHQSNGLAGTQSRSWNRLYANSILIKGPLALGIKVWLKFSGDSSDTDNPDISNYLGHGELRAIYKQTDHTFSLMSRNNLESGFSRGAIELGWSFPTGNRKDLKGYLQLFSGYGESLTDYNHLVNTIGVGIIMSDWL